MLQIVYSHQLHGIQEIKCKELVKIDEIMHAKNIHNATFQTLEPNRILKISILPSYENQ